MFQKDFSNNVCLAGRWETFTVPSQRRIAEAERLAKEDSPSRVLVYDSKLEIEEEKSF
ncbi:hypothetical protein GA0061096_3888 [Fictibacillus enclensis]|uniref:hypothetical protein n=1 Tax=Fictibacillus enclensis TaxID=1017270 RepID=UPI0008160C43|nr:hypothetical protein [Fictibacillus enclensis]SCC33322.1 hypothetical protein GA0061096_3888 [Fictibacillus enclensis]